MLDFNAAQYQGDGGCALNREFCFLLPEGISGEITSVRLPAGRDSGPLTVVVTIRESADDKPGRVIRESFKQVFQVKWYEFPISPLMLSTRERYWLGFKGVDPNAGPSVVIMGPGLFVGPFSGSPDAQATSSFISKGDSWDGPYTHRPVFSLVGQAG